MTAASQLRACARALSRVSNAVAEFDTSASVDCHFQSTPYVPALGDTLAQSRQVSIRFVSADLADVLVEGSLVRIFSDLPDASGEYRIGLVTRLPNSGHTLVELHT